MNNIKIIILILIIFSLGLVLYIQNGAEREVVKVEEDVQQQEVVKIDLDSYKNETGALYKEIRSLINREGEIDSSLGTEIAAEESFSKIETLKNKLFSITAPTEDFRSLHFNLVFALNNYEKYIAAPDSQLKEKSKKYLDSAENEHGWLKEKLL